MFIDELTPGTKIKIIVKLNNNEMEFDTTVHKSLYTKNMIAVNVIRKDDKLLTFNVPNILIDCIYSPEDGLPILFKNVSVSIVREKEEIYYVVKSIVEGKTLNRRQNFRVFIGQNLIAQFGLNRKTTRILLKDISSSGFAVIVQDSEEPEYKINSSVHLVFNDRIDDMCENFSFNLHGTIVRVVPLENNKGILYGCSLYQKVDGLDRYLNIKERLRLRELRGTRIKK